MIGIVIGVVIGVVIGDSNRGGSTQVRGCVGVKEHKVWWAGGDDMCKVMCKLWCLIA